MKATKSHVIRVYNCSKQMIQLQARAPGSDFYSSEIQVRLMPGKDAVLPKSYLYSEQIKNLQAKKMIQVLHDSETIDK